MVCTMTLCSKFIAISRNFQNYPLKHLLNKKLTMYILHILQNYTMHIRHIGPTHLVCLMSKTVSPGYHLDFPSQKVLKSRYYLLTLMKTK